MQDQLSLLTAGTQTTNEACYRAIKRGDAAGLEKLLRFRDAFINTGNSEFSCMGMAAVASNNCAVLKLIINREDFQPHGNIKGGRTEDMFRDGCIAEQMFSDALVKNHLEITKCIAVHPKIVIDFPMGHGMTFLDKALCDQYKNEELAVVLLKRLKVEKNTRDSVTSDNLSSMISLNFRDAFVEALTIDGLEKLFISNNIIWNAAPITASAKIGCDPFFLEEMIKHPAFDALSAIAVLSDPPCYNGEEHANAIINSIIFIIDRAKLDFRAKSELFCRSYPILPKKTDCPCYLRVADAIFKKIMPLVNPLTDLVVGNSYEDKGKRVNEKPITYTLRTYKYDRTPLLNYLLSLPTFFVGTGKDGFIRMAHSVYLDLGRLKMVVVHPHLVKEIENVKSSEFEVMLRDSIVKANGYETVKIFAAASDTYAYHTWMALTLTLLDELKKTIWHRFNDALTKGWNEIFDTLQKSGPHSAHLKWRKDIYGDIDAARTFTLVTMTSDSYFNVGNYVGPVAKVTKKEKARRFFRVLKGLPQELQMIFVNRCGGSMKDIIKAEAVEEALKFWVIFLWNEEEAE